ncbi:MAG TPA: hypothetical protein V6C81_13105 [Planktothrix sp.]
MERSIASCLFNLSSGVLVGDSLEFLLKERRDVEHLSKADLIGAAQPRVPPQGGKHGIDT